VGEEYLEEVENEGDAQKGKFMTFRCGKESFAIEIKYVTEIIGIQNITAIPEVADYIKGLINLRGKIIPVIDVKIRFKKEPFAYTDRTCIIVINVKGTEVGLIIENIAEVVNIEEKDILPPPTIGQSQEQNKYVYGIGKVGDEVKLLLDPEKLIKDEELTSLGQIAESAQEASEE
jgi:purine-binding chemotaxis protein CheW